MGRADRETLQSLIPQLSTLGVDLFYLASWHDPFGDPDEYAREVFSAWELGTGDVLVVFLREGDRWQVAGVLGAGVPIAQGAFERALARAASRANLAPPARAAISLAEDLLALAGSGGSGEGEGEPVWLYALGGLVGLAVVWVARGRLCPRCWFPLHRRASWLGGIMSVCPRCRYTRAPRRGRGTGSRRGIYP